MDPEALEAIRRMTEAGIPVVLATGNVLPIALALHRFLGLDTPIIAENGGVLYRRAGGRDIVEHLADRRVALAAYRSLVRAGLPVHRLFTDRWREAEVAIEEGLPERRLRAVLRGQPVLVESTGFAVHLMERGAGKLPALRRALGPMGLTPGDCLAIGDGNNDVAMLRASAWAVTFPSGSARARRAADYVTRTEYGCGFVEAVIHAGVVPPPVYG
ncbi:MAG: HAD hydrolase family protein [Thermoplasmata archaeon]|nr:HAD hydrolase family protein [Thermoplasmata archaeon]